MVHWGRPLVFCSVAAMLTFAAPAHAARDAAFMAPGATRGGTVQSDQAIAIEPKADVDAGDTPLNVGRRATFFFVNQSNVPVNVESVAANGDSNVKAEIVGDDCSKEKTIPAGSRCAVTVDTTPSGSGSWTAEILMTHNAAGRIARARVMGKTAASSLTKSEMGLALSTKDVKPVDFGDVEPGTGKAVRTALMVNDSNEIISILSIEVIAPENGLARLEQGCAVDMDLKMGESCPVTLMWNPEHKGSVSTDLIIRHTGRLGFAVIPIRGIAKEPVDKSGNAASGKTAATSSSSSSNDAPKAGSKVPLSPSAEDVEKILADGKMPQISTHDLPQMALSDKPSKKASHSADYHLIGTVGNRALIYKPDGTTAVVGNGEEMTEDGSVVLKVINVSPKEVEVLLDGARVKLKLERVSALTDKAERTSTMPAFTKSATPSVSEGASKKSSSKKEKSTKLDSGDGGSSVSLPAGM